MVSACSHWDVTAGRIGSFVGYPVLLTPTDHLNAETEQALLDPAPSRVLVPGGTASVDDATFATIEAVLPEAEVRRVAGPTRIETGAELTRLALDELYPESEESPQYAVVVGLLPCGRGSRGRRGLRGVAARGPGDRSWMTGRRTGALPDARQRVRS